MNDQYDSLIKHLLVNYKEHGTVPSGVTWGENTQRIQNRYDSLLAKIPKTDKKITILDVGSGYGEFIKYLEIKFDQFDYWGIDLLSDYIDAGSKLYEYRYNFICADFLEYEFKQQFDFVVCNGAFNNKFEHSNKDMLDRVRKIIIKMYSLCNSAAIFNLISTYVNFFNESMFYKSPVEMLSWCFENITTKVDLDHSSVEYEYFITLKK